MLRSLLKTTSLFFSDAVFRGLLFAALAALVTGTIFYHYVEGWSWLDSFYFCTITLATVGYGDFTPTDDVSRLFTILYVMFGAGIFATFVTADAVVRLQHSGATRNFGITKAQSLSAVAGPEHGTPAARRSSGAETLPEASASPAPRQRCSGG
jgi:hypothetical protein